MWNLRRSLLLSTLLGAALSIAGCGKEEPKTAAAPKAADAPKSEPAKTEAPAATLERAEYRVAVQAPDTLRTLLTTYLDLARFQNAPATEGITAAELERLVRAAPAQARSLLETAGHFSADVKVERGPTQGGALPLLRVIVEPGPQARVAAFTLDVNEIGRASCRERV